MLSDLRFSFRQLRRHPGFALAAIATLAIGIGATTAIFSTVNAAVLRPLPFPHPEDLFSLDTPATDGRFTTGLVSGVEMIRLLTPAGSFQNVSGSSRLDTTILRDDGTALNVMAYGVTEGFFEIFEMPPSVGRTFTHEEYQPRGAPAIVLSYHLWRNLFGSDPAAIGKTLRIANGPPSMTIVGVSSRDLDVPRGADFWTNFSITPQATGHGFDGYVRLKPGAHPGLENEMAAAMTGIANEYGTIAKNRRYALKPLGEAMVGDLRSTLIIVLGAA